MIRVATIRDTAELIDLWRSAGLRFHPDLVERELTAMLPDGLVLVDEEAGELAGTVFGTYDSTRGWIHRLATRPDHRGRGIASALLAELERRLRAVGCPKVNLLIEPGHAAVASFYARLGYRPDELLFMEKWLVPEPDDLYVPNGAGNPDPAPVSAPDGWRDIRPELSAEPYVFAAGELTDPPPGLSPFAIIREDEGVTLILTRADADRAGLAYEYIAARITLRVGSALTDVGLTALFSRTLAAAGISCNVIAGLAHDHLFVDWDQAARALALLRRL
jgi:GNAT superfamily N-acetyltransferase